MRSVRTSKTEPEERLAAAAAKLGLRFRRNDSRVVGKPDMCFRNARLAVFVDGDFWHGRTWFAKGRAPATNVSFWIAKFERNHARDRMVEAKLRSAGWSVMRIWGSDIRRAPHAAAQRVRARLRRLARAGRPFPCAQRRSKSRSGGSACRA
jgi:DNA mismatch endonuclease (patch repair protein)